VTTGIKIVCISDTHEQHAKLQVPEGDILIPWPSSSIGH
jgi:hypothetical protein